MARSGFILCQHGATAYMELIRVNLLHIPAPQGSEGEGEEAKGLQQEQRRGNTLHWTSDGKQRPDKSCPKIIQSSLKTTKNPAPKRPKM